MSIAISPCILSPISQSDFLRDHFEKNFFVVTGRDKNFFSEVLSFQEIDSLLSFGNLTTANVRMFKNGDAVDPQKYSVVSKKLGSVRRVEPNRVSQLFYDGATIILEGIHRYHESIYHICRQLEKAFCHKFQANTYITPPMSEGFRAHSDGHDVFICQVYGTKIWRVDCNASNLSKDGEFTNHSDETCEFALNPGETLYIPRGRVHSAKSTEDISVHITVGMLSKTWGQFLKDDIDAFAKNFSILNKSVPMWEGKEKFDEEYLQIKKGVLERWNTEEFRSVGKRAHFENLSRNQHLASGGISRSYKQIGSRKWRVRSDLIYTISHEQEGIAINYGNVVIRLPKKVERAISYLVYTRKFKGSDLEYWMDKRSAEILVKKLYESGFLEIVE